MEQEIKEMLKELLENSDVLNIGNDDSLIGFGLDSLKAIELVVMIEEKYGISFDEENLLLENLLTINLIIKSINS